MKRSLLAAGLSGLLLMGSLAPALAREDSPTPVTSPNVVASHSSSLGGRNIAVLLVLLLVVVAVAAN